MNYNLLITNLNKGEVLILDFADTIKLISNIDPIYETPWLYKYIQFFKIYKYKDEYIIEPGKKKGGI